MEDVLAAKIAALFIVLVISVIFGNAPYWVLKRRQTPQGTRRRNLFISIFNAFSGGVFLGTCLLHLMVEGREELGDAFSKYGVTMDYPLFEVLVAFGFFAITFIDFVAELCFHGSNSIILEAKKPKPPIAALESGVTNTNYISNEVANAGNLERYGAIVPDDKRHSTASDNNNISTVVPSTDPAAQITYTSNGNPPASTEVVIDETRGHDHQYHQHNHGHDHSTHEFDDLAKASTIRAVLLLIALSFHTIFDGLAIGLQEQDSDVWQVLVAISVHKGLVAFCLGHQLYQAYKERTKLAVILVQLFCLMSPIGIALGIIITSGNIDDAAQTMTSAILQGIASGTFLYVTFFEILSTAFTHGQSIWNIVLAAVGFAAMAAVKLLDTD